MKIYLKNFSCKISSPAAMNKKLSMQDRAQKVDINYEILAKS